MRYLPLGCGSVLVLLALLLLTRDEPGFHLSMPDTSSLPAAATSGVTLADDPPGNAEAGTLPIAGALEPGAAQTALAAAQGSAGAGQTGDQPPTGGETAGSPVGGQPVNGQPVSGQPAGSPPIADGQGGGGQGGDSQGGGGQGGGGQGGGGQGGGGLRAGTATPELPSGVLALIGLLPLGLAGIWLRRRGAAPGAR